MTKTAYSMLCALCIALSAAVQSVFSGFRTDCAVYYAVFICTVCCPLKYGLFCAAVCPVISMMTTGGPAAAVLPAGMAKCFVFVLLVKLLFGTVRTGRLSADLYICLIPALCIAQTVGAVVSAAVFCGTEEAVWVYIIARLLTSVPEIVLLLAIIPGTVLLLKNLGMVKTKDMSEKKTDSV